MPPRSLARAVVGFAALLRRNSLPITPLQTVDGVRTLDHLDLGDRAELQRGLRAVFVTRPEEVAIFDRCFETFWRARSEADAVAEALAGLHADHLDETLVNETLGCVLKDADDMKRFRAEVGKSGLAPFVKTG